MLHVSMDLPAADSGTVASCIAQGDVLSSNVSHLQKQANAHFDGNGTWKTLVLDLRASRVVDSVGLNSLVTIIKLCKARGAAVRIRIAHDSLQRILQFTRIHLHAQVVRE